MVSRVLLEIRGGCSRYQKHNKKRKSTEVVTLAYVVKLVLAGRQKTESPPLSRGMLKRFDKPSTSGNSHENMNNSNNEHDYH